MLRRVTFIGVVGRNGIQFELYILVVACAKSLSLKLDTRTHAIRARTPEAALVRTDPHRQRSVEARDSFSLSPPLWWNWQTRLVWHTSPMCLNRNTYRFSQRCWLTNKQFKKISRTLRRGELSYCVVETKKFAHASDVRVEMMWTSQRMRWRTFHVLERLARNWVICTITCAIYSQLGMCVRRFCALTCIHEGWIIVYSFVGAKEIVLYMWLLFLSAMISLFEDYVRSKSGVGNMFGHYVVPLFTHSNAEIQIHRRNMYMLYVCVVVLRSHFRPCARKYGLHNSASVHYF